MNCSCCYIFGLLMLFIGYCVVVIIDSVIKENENKVLQVFIKCQVNQFMLVGWVVGLIISNYFNEVEIIVVIVLDLYLENYQEIIYVVIFL